MSVFYVYPVFHKKANKTFFRYFFCTTHWHAVGTSVRSLSPLCIHWNSVSLMSLRKFYKCTCSTRSSQTLSINTQCKETKQVAWFIHLFSIFIWSSVRSRSGSHLLTIQSCPPCGGMPSLTSVFCWVYLNMVRHLCSGGCFGLLLVVPLLSAYTFRFISLICSMGPQVITMYTEF